MQWGKGPLHKWTNLALKKAILDAGLNYQFKAAELLNDFDFEEWLDSAEQSDNEWEFSEPQGLIIGHTHESADKIFSQVSAALHTRSRILQGGVMHDKEPETDDEDEDVPDVIGAKKRKRGRLIDEEAGEH